MIFYHFFSNPWAVFALKLAAVFIFFLTAPLVLGYVEHKGLAHMQSRLGPMEAGRFHGWAQLIADGVKFIQKEDIVPDAADRRIFMLAPMIVIIPVSLVFLVIPFGPAAVSCHAPAGTGGCGFWGENFDVGIFFVLAISAISVIGMLMAGWASANKFSLIGAIRGAAQLIAYELPLVLAASAVAMQAGTLSLVGIGDAQKAYWFVFPQIAGFIIFVIASLAELSRPPFDMPIADSEIIFGHMTEYTGIRFGLFLLSEYAGIVSLSAIAVVLYLGAWHGFIVPWIPGPIWTLAKIGALSFLVIWLRATYPRLREDQLQKMAWKYLIPIALVNILLTMIFKVVF
ncbi:MAG: NADH-quinone oxidoreductase subunit NuoH [Actinobacteria bacterium]|nr:MAG: NADH-quinone oxidoreductase subunit NuoH [Actinomycetota bacterium]